MLTLLPLVLLAASSADSIVQDDGVADPAPASQVVLSDDEHGVTVIFIEKDSQTVEFSSELPPDWDYFVVVDANKDGVWGYGYDVPKGYPEQRHITGDRMFGLASDDRFCAQHVLTASSQDPRWIALSSVCGDFVSKGRAKIGNPNANDRRKIVLSLPTEDIFGSDPHAHVMVCVWNEERGNTCEQQPGELLVLTRLSVGSP